MRTETALTRLVEDDAAPVMARVRALEQIEHPPLAVLRRLLVTFNSMNSLDTVEAVMAFEEAFGVELPVHESGDFGTPQEMVDWLELHLSNQRLSKHAVVLLRKLAKDRNNPELAEGLEGTWRREQIAAIVLEIFRQ